MEEIANPFTFPPSQYRIYTKRNLVLLELLRSRSGTKLHDEIPVEEQQRLLADQGEPVVDWDLTRLERPRVDWIQENGGYETFGDPWPVCRLVALLRCSPVTHRPSLSQLPNRQLTLEEHGVQQLYPNVPGSFVVNPQKRNLTTKTQTIDLLSANCSEPFS